MIFKKYIMEISKLKSGGKTDSSQVKKWVRMSWENGVWVETIFREPNH